MHDVDHLQDVVYGYKDGLALVMDVYTPRDPRVDAGVILAVSGGWSTDRARRTAMLEPDPGNWHVLPRCLLDAGYVVFAAAHGAQPRYNIQELRPDLPRAVRFIRHHAERFHINPQRLGMVGGSSGGHVTLMAALAPPAADSSAEDPLDRASSIVQAAVAFFPPTDLLSYGQANLTMLAAHGGPRAAALDFRRFDAQACRYERITAAGDLRACLQEHSPVTHVRADNPPTLLIHGDQDQLVPLQQSEALRTRLQNANVTNKLVILPGHGHAWPPLGPAHEETLEWFRRYL